MSKTKNQIAHQALKGSVLHYLRQHGVGAVQRTRPYLDWCERRECNDVFPFQRTSEALPGRQIIVDGADHLGPILNFSSQDYLGLASDPRMGEAAARAVRDFGVHSAGSPAFCGSTRISRDLEAMIAEIVGGEEAMVYATGWAAGYGVLVGMIREDDVLLMDALSHNCIQEGARACGAEVRKFRHNDLDQVSEMLAEIRAERPDRGIFVVAESLYSMDSDSPDLGVLLDLCEKHQAISILDVAHDFGSMGNHGRGLLDSVEGRLPDVVLGSFSKTFAANGGFAVGKREVIHYLRFYAPSSLFSNAISPMQSGVAMEAFRIAFSDEGEELRELLNTRVNLLRNAMNEKGLQVHGDASPICPVFVGDEGLARLTSKHVAELGMAANLVEFPAVARGKARFRFQVMASHEEGDVRRAAEIMAEAKRRAEEELNGAEAD